LALGSGAHLIGLERTRIGEVRLENCWQIDDLIDFLDKPLFNPDEKIGIN